MTAPYEPGQHVTVRSSANFCPACGSRDFEFVQDESGAGTVGLFRCLSHDGALLYARKYSVTSPAYDTPDDEPEDELECTACGHTVWVSPEDGDAALSEMVRHFRAKHHGEDVNALLARVRLIEGGTR